MLNNKYTEGEYYNFFQLQQTFIGCLGRWGYEEDQGEVTVPKVLIV